MTRDDIIRLAREAGWPNSLIAPVIMAKLAEFAALVAAAEREACAKEADLVAREFHNGMATYIAAAIRARGE
jgi:hypothetical protein